MNFTSPVSNSPPTAAAYRRFTTINYDDECIKKVDIMENKSSSQEIVEPEKERLEEEEEEEEYVLLDLSIISDHISIPPNAPYVLSGLDTVNPILTIDNKIKLIGEYEETIGTCFVFSESDADPIVNEEEAGSSKAKKTPSKQINPMARLNKVLKFRPYLGASEDGVEKCADKPS